MYRIFETTDNKYLGTEIKELNDHIDFPDGFYFRIDFKKEENGIITVSNNNYIVRLKRVENIVPVVKTVAKKEKKNKTRRNK